MANLALVGAYRLALDVPSRALERLLALALLSSLAALPLAGRSGRAAALLHNGQLALLSVALVLLGTELAWRAAPSLFPQAIRDQLQERDVEAERRAVVEYLDASPFVKFKPNVRVRSQGYRGTPEEFVYEWTTDARGFKNPPQLGADGPFDVVALGDSFTEGMGVAAEDTWPALLTRAGRRAYNLAVQGYAPSQMAGVFARYAAELGPSLVVVGYCSGIYGREEAFLDEDAARRNRRFTGGIQSSVDREIRVQQRFVTSVAFLKGYSALASGVTAFKDLFRGSRQARPVAAALPIVFEPFRRYAPSFGGVTGFSREIREIETGSREWRRTLEALLAIRDQARALGAPTLLVYLPGRGEMYFEKATGLRLPDRTLEVVEAQALQAFCRANGIGFANPASRIRGYVGGLREDADVRDFPYLPRDAHPSPRGHALIAAEVLEALDAGAARRGAAGLP